MEIKRAKKPGWLVINTLANQERHAVLNLNRQGFHVYCPMTMRRIKHARRVQDVTRPLFPGYVFVEFTSEMARWRSILGTYGVKSLVRMGEQLGFLSGHLIEALRAREKDGIVCKPASPIEVGQRATIQGGPFDGLIGEVIQLCDKDRVLFLLSLLNRPTKTYIPASILNPLTN